MAKQRLSEQEQASLLDGLLIPKQEPLPTQMHTPAAQVREQTPRMERASSRRTAVPDHTGVFNYSDIDRAWFWTVRSFALFALLISGMGTIQSLAGRWPASLPTIMDAWPVWAILGGIVIQGIVTLVEWRFARQWLTSWPWWMAVAIDLLFTCWGYASIGIPWLLNRWHAAGITGDWGDRGAWAALILFSLAIALFPEQTLVRPEA